MACPPIHNGVPLQHDSTKGSCMYMSNEPLTFNDLPQVVAELRDEVSGMKALPNVLTVVCSRPNAETCTKWYHEKLKC